MRRNLQTDAEIYKSNCRMRYRLADAALQHAILKKSNKSIYIAFTHLAEIEALEVPLYKYEDLYYQYRLPFSEEAVKECSAKLVELHLEIIKQ